MFSYTLKNGVQIPAVGFGTYKSLDVRDESIILDATAAGYRLFDTASFYQNEEGIGKGLAASGVPRKELFLTSKLWKTELGYDSALKSFETSLKKLQTDYLDLYLIHWPITDPAHAWKDDAWRRTLSDTWRALERLYEEGEVRAIGVSNFLPHHLEVVFGMASVPPMVNQLEYHPGHTQQYAVDFSKEHGIQVEAWSPLGRARVMDEPFLLELAGKYHVTPAQICLRFAVQTGVIPLPKASSIERMRQNLDVFDFEISREDMQRLLTLPPIGWGGEHPDRARA